MKNVLCLLLGLLGLLAGPAAGQPAKVALSGQVLSLSDIHFGVSDSAQLALPADVSQWADVLKLKKYSDSRPITPNTWQDSNYWLLMSSLAEMKARCPHPDFIVISGDLLAHDVGSSPFDSVSTQFALARRIYRFVQLQLATQFPHTVILPGLGNNDTNAGDDQPPTPAFLRMFARAWLPSLPMPDTAAFVQSFAQGGYYRYVLPGPAAPGQRKLLMLNSVLFMVDTATCGKPKLTKGPWSRARAELAWLRQELHATAPTDKLWLAMHVPYGMDAYQCIRPYGQPICSDTVMAGRQLHAMWSTWATTVYRSLVGSKLYAPRIKASLAGHTHMAEFRLLTNLQHQPAGFVHVTPSISPYFGNNPGFQVLDYDRATLALQDARTHYLNLGPVPASLYPAGQSWRPTWKPEYAFSQAYQVTGGINVATLEAVRTKIRPFASPYQLRYAAYYAGLATPVSYSGGPVWVNGQKAAPKITNPTPTSELSWLFFWCNTGHTSPQEFCDCLDKELHLPPPPSATATR